MITIPQLAAQALGSFLMEEIEGRFVARTARAGNVRTMSMAIVDFIESESE